MTVLVSAISAEDYQGAAESTGFFGGTEYEFDRKKSRRLPKSVSFRSRLVGQALLAVFLAACSSGSAAENSSTQPPETAVEPSPVIEAIPTSENAPSSFTENLPTLQEMGFSLRQGERGWELVDKNGVVAFSSADALTITAYGANGELIVVPEQAFGITGTAGLGMEQIITLKDEQGVNAYMYLDRAGYSAPAIGQSNDFEDLENCKRVDIDSLRTGQLAQNEALHMKEFPEGTIAPDGFAYGLWKGNQVFWVLLHDIVEGHTDMSPNSRESNYHRRYVDCFRSTTPKGVEVIIAAEQVLMPDKVTSLSQFYVYDLAWLKKQGIKYAGELWNLRHSVLEAYTQEPPEGYASVPMRPEIFIEAHDPNYSPDRLGLDITGEPAAVMELYRLPQNDPSNLYSRIIEMARRQQAGMTGTNTWLDWASNEELFESQFRGYLAGWGNGIWENFIENN